MVSWKAEIIDPLDTTATVFGGKTTNYILQYFKGIDLSELDTDPEGIADISTFTYFANNTLNLWDSDKSHRIRVQVPDYTENKTYLFPPEAAVGPSEEFVFKDSVQILTNKSISFGDNTITGITKAALPSTVVFNDQNNDLGEFYLDVRQIAVPNSPVSGRRRIFVSTTTGKLSIRRDDGIVVSLEEGAFNTAGGFAAGGVATFSGDGSTKIFTIPHGMPQVPDVVVLNPMNIDTSSDFNYDMDGTNITVTFNVPPQTGTDNVILNWGVGYINPDALTFTATSVVTLSNKTINVDENTIKHSTTNTAGDLLKGDGTQYSRFVKGTALQLPRVNSGATDLEYASPSTIFDAYYDLPKITIPADPSTEDSRTYLKEVNTNNNTIASKFQINGSIVEVDYF